MCWILGYLRAKNPMVPVLNHLGGYRSGYSKLWEIINSWLARVSSQSRTVFRFGFYDGIAISANLSVSLSSCVVAFQIAGTRSDLWRWISLNFISMLMPGLWQSWTSSSRSWQGFSCMILRSRSVASLFSCLEFFCKAFGFPDTRICSSRGVWSRNVVVWCLPYSRMKSLSGSWIFASQLYSLLFGPAADSELMLFFLTNLLNVTINCCTKGLTLIGEV